MTAPNDNLVKWRLRRWGRGGWGATYWKDDIRYLSRTCKSIELSFCPWLMGSCYHLSLKEGQKECLMFCFQFQVLFVFDSRFYIVGLDCLFCVCFWGDILTVVLHCNFLNWYSGLHKIVVSNQFQWISVLLLPSISWCVEPFFSFIFFPSLRSSYLSSQAKIKGLRPLLSWPILYHVVVDTTKKGRGTKKSILRCFSLTSPSLSLSLSLNQ